MDTCVIMVVADDVFIIIALPEGNTRGFEIFVDTSRGKCFKCTDNFGETVCFCRGGFHLCLLQGAGKPAPTTSFKIIIP